MGKHPATPLDRISAVAIDPTQIPTVDRNNLCAAILPAVNKFYDDPENRKRFEEWKRQGSKIKEAIIYV